MLVILRGLPGSGKSSFVASNLSDAVVVSADAFFHDEKSGKYNYNHTGLEAAHVQCQELCRMHMKRQTKLICVDNCNLVAKGRFFEKTTRKTVVFLFFSFLSFLFLSCLFLSCLLACFKFGEDCVSFFF